MSQYSARCLNWLRRRLGAVAVSALAVSSAALAVSSAALALTAFEAPALARGESDDPPRTAPPLEKVFLDSYCSSCHNDKLERGGLSFAAVDVEHVANDPELWEKVVHKLQARFMPPQGRERPDEATYDRMVASLVATLDREAAAHPDPGDMPALHRLNRTEYRNAIRDLLALDVDVSSLLPKDEPSHGFDNVGVAGINPSLLERYLAAAQKISRLAVGRPVRSPGATVIELAGDFTQEEYVEGLPFGTRGGASVRHVFPRDGVYEIQIQPMRSDGQSIDALNEPHDLELSVDGAQVALFALRAHIERHALKDGEEASSPAGEDFKAVVTMAAGPHDVGAAFLKNPSSLLETERQPYQAAFNPARHPRPQPAVYSISIVGPLEDHGPGSTASRDRIFVCTPAAGSEEDACARRILTTLLRRAYRRPIDDKDLAAPLEFFAQGRADGGFEAGIEMALRAILVDPAFLFRIERDPPGLSPGSTYRIDDLALASRLSFFLWSSIPDDELLSVAEAGTLHDDAVLERQIRRMLADPRAKALSTNFADQWLYLRNLDTAYPDPRLFPDFDDNLRQAMRRETELFFQSVVDDDRPVIELLTADYSFLNERLARHYEVPNVYGPRFRRVTFPSGSVRGGLLGQGSILTVTAYANRTSPVLRGKWILDTILGAAPPPPPGNVPALQEGKPGVKVLPMRERMAEHRTNPGCSGCHNLMDPIGFSTERFDAVGRYRVRDESGTTIDEQGALPDGTAYSGVGGLYHAVLLRPDIFVTAMTEKLLTYALGRGLDARDAPAIRDIVRESSADDHRFSSIALAIARSTPFQMRRSR